ncbi:molybdate ABC transporter substrate-binding protein [Novosphingobium sp. 9]|uniref:molybdate ABC transporter substrate-binding protein n=1 Tax=Novosphingobium sp. 9 TaxID=2025349 RepID=UPI0021B4D594|nr:molybdate ABC transporter substrate-binding protein [Novosphingobium sp. 9]
MPQPFLKRRETLGAMALACTALWIGGTSALARPAQTAPVVLAAASLQESMNAAADAWSAKGHPRPRISFAGSSALARQVESGAPADLFVSADEKWMNELQSRNLLAPGTRSSFLRNTLVLIAPTNSRIRLTIRPGFPLAQTLGNGRLAVADTNAVPAGLYAKEALGKLGVWPSVQGKLAPGDSVRAALRMVSSGAAPLGIVYATDAKADPGVKVIATFPAASHTPITYPVARLKASQNPEGEGFRRFLLSGQGRAIFARFGFGTH